MLRWPFHENDRAQAERDTQGHIKVIATPRGKILGATIVGTEAGEMITAWALAVAQGMNIRAMAGVVVPVSGARGSRKRAADRLFRAQFDEPSGALHHRLAAALRMT